MQLSQFRPLSPLLILDLDKYSDFLPYRHVFNVSMKNSWRRNAPNLLLETIKMKRDIRYAGSRHRYLVGGACIKLSRHRLISFVKYEFSKKLFAPSITNTLKMSRVNHY